MLKSFEFVIPIKPVTKKNSQQIVTIKGRPIIIPSKAYKQYEKEAIKLLAPYITDDFPIEYPVEMKCLFYMPTHRQCDLTNLLESADDVLVRAKILSDDNFNIIESHDGSRVLYDHDFPRTEIYIRPIER